MGQIVQTWPVDLQITINLVRCSQLADEAKFAGLQLTEAGWKSCCPRLSNACRTHRRRTRGELLNANDRDGEAMMFDSPWYFLLLLLVPVLAWRLFAPSRMAGSSIQLRRARRRLPPTLRQRMTWLPAALTVAAIVF